MRYVPGLNTTAGSFALLKSVVPEDAGVIKRLRAAGAIVLGVCSLARLFIYDPMAKLAFRKSEPLGVGALQRQCCVGLVRAQRAGDERILPERRPMWLVVRLGDWRVHWARCSDSGHGD